jgi:Cu+-exporting ATPase
MLKPTLVSIVALDGRDDDTLLALAAGAARGLENPLGTAILESARERDVEVAAVDRVHESAGAGVVAAVEGRTVVVGNAALFNTLGLSLTRFGDWPERLRLRGQTRPVRGGGWQSVGIPGRDRFSCVSAGVWDPVHHHSCDSVPLVY